MAKVAKLLVRNRPLGHYVLSVYSLLFRGYCIDDKNDIITLIAPSRSIGRTTDLANMLARVCAPGLLWLSPKRTKISNRLQMGDVYPKVSNLIVKLTSFERESEPDDEKVRISQNKEKRDALKGFNDRRKKRREDPITMEEYPFIEALAGYREGHPGTSLKEVRDNLDKFKRGLQKIQDEFLDKIVKAIPSDRLLKKRAGQSSLLQSYRAKGGKPGEPQKLNICELEFILSTLLKEGCELHFTCPDDTSSDKRGNIELKFTPEDQDKIQVIKWDKNEIIRDKNRNKIVEIKEGKLMLVKTKEKIDREKLSLNKNLQLEYDGKVICANPQTRFKYVIVQGKKDKDKKWFNVPGEEIDLGKVFVKVENSGRQYKEAINIRYKPSTSNSLPVTVETCHHVKSSIEAALMRMGLLPSPQLDELAKDMCRFDDILVGLDTSCFYHGVVTGALLDSFVGVARYPYLDTPNWITLVASVISTGEIEHKANASKDYFDDKDTQDTHNRRTAFRALQEFMEMSTCADLEGVATLLTGEISPDIDFSGDNTIRDELIRKQIKNFLGNIGFHTGTYFLTGDRKCAMFARAEGLHAVHLKRKPLDTTKDIPLTDLSPRNYGDERDIHNVSELVYELGIEFPLKITCIGENCKLSGLSFIVQTDWPGKSLEEWENRNFMVRFAEGNENIYGDFYNCLQNNAKAVKLGQLLWGWKQANARHHEEPGYPSWAT